MPPKSNNYMKLLCCIAQLNNLEEVTALEYVLREKHKELNEVKSLDIKYELNIGDTVRIADIHLKGKADRLYKVTGQIKKKNPSKAIVMFGDVKWNVPYTMLVRVEE